jgi:cell division protein FtsW (lipid II flippase)
MNFPLLSARSIERRLLIFSAGILFLLAVILTLSTSARERTWDVDYRWSHWAGYFIWAGTALSVHWMYRKKLQDTDAFIFPFAAFLSGLGILLIWRLIPSFGMRQALWFVVGGIVFILGAWHYYKITILRRYKYILLLSGIFLTALTLIFGTNPLGDGPRLWLGCCGVYLQPSEPLKLILVIYLSAYFADNLPFPQGLFPLILPTILMTGLALLILVVQRDLGTASIFIFLYATILYLATGRKRVILVSLFILVMAGVVGYFAVDIIQVRLVAWLNPWSDPSGSGYQTIQSLFAISNGGLPGRGLGMGYPGLVPVASSDFIFAAMAEEMGLLGTILLLCFYSIIISRGVRIAMRAQDTFRRLLAAGLAAYLGAQSILIIGGNLRLLPLTGVTLPFLSYGGSSLLTSMIAILLIIIIGSQPEDESAPLQNPAPYLHLSLLFFAVLFGLAITNAWWSVWRAEDLLARTDNPRRAISDAYVVRGDLVDRSFQPINITTGESGSYSRQYIYPDLSPISGYINSTFGQSGLELTLDPYLRGLRGNPEIQIWWNHLLYGTPPPGSTARLTIDLQFQSTVDELLRGRKGSAILLNARTGEILAMASHPTFDPNTLSETGSQLINDPDAPLLNRATQGAYSAGTILSLFIHAKEIEKGAALTTQDLIDLYKMLGFFQQPQVNLPVGSAPVPANIEQLRISPLQAALAAATLANEGLKSEGQIVSGIKPQNSDWIILSPQNNSVQIFSSSTVEKVTENALVAMQPYWRIVSEDISPTSGIAWFIGGTPSGWQGTPLIAVVALENGDTEMADFIGQGLLKSALDK